MLDFTEGWVWFVAGLAATTLVAVLLFVVAVVAGRNQRPRGGGVRHGGAPPAH